MKLAGMMESSRARYDADIKVSRSEAKDRGLRVFWTGDPCLRGHVAHRYVLGGKCVECCKARNKRNIAAQKGDKLRSDAAAAGISPDARRAAERMRDQMMLDRELSGYYP